MSRIYSNSQVYCPPIDAQATNAAFEHTPSSQLHHLSRLLYCSSCRSPRPQHQCTPQIIMRYCSMCLSDYSSARLRVGFCSSNCYVCPTCMSPLAIEMLSREKSKAFTFNCSHCDFLYTTRLVTKPQSLQDILKNEATSDRLQTEVFENYLHNVVHRDENKSVHSEQQLNNLKLSRLHIGTNDSASSITLADAEQTESRRSSTRLEPPLNNSRIDGPSRSQPKPNKLTCKFSLQCSKCSKILKCPDPSLPVTKPKYKIECNAVDHLPSIHISPMNGTPVTNSTDPELLSYQCIISIQNPTKRPQIISITSPIQLALPFTEESNLREARISMNAHKCVVPAESSTVIDLIPKSFLSNRTVDVSEDKFSLLGHVKGPNWIEVPFEINLAPTGDERTFYVRVPFHITVEEAQQDLHDAEKFSEPPVSCKYWSVVDLTLDKPV